MQKEVLGDRYQLLEPIGRGGMATVYRGHDLRMDRIIAVKVLREAYSTDPKFVTRFQREAKAASALQHPNIVQVSDYGQSDGVYYIVMELIDGTDLRRYLRSRGILAIDRAVIIAHDVALGLGAAHRRDIVNRDVKPQNILVGRDGSIKLTDFGIAMIYQDINTERLTTTGMTLGTVQYYAPEQAQGEIVTPAADVYALGIVIYEMLTGHTPFDGDTPVAVAMQHIQDTPVPPSQYNPNIPAKLEEIILRCLEKVPEMRYRNGSVLAKALEAFMEEAFGDVTPLPDVPRSNIPPRPNTSRGQQGPVGPAPAPRLASSPNNMFPPAAPTPPISPVPAAPLNQPNGDGLNDATLLSSDALQSEQTMRMSDRAGTSPPGYGGMNGANGSNGSHGSNGFNGTHGPEYIGANGFAAQDAGTYNPSGYMGSGSTRPYQRDVLAGRAAKPDQQDQSFTGVVTVLILVVTLIFLGFCVFLAIQLGLLPFGHTNAQPTPTSAVSVTVPSLRNESYGQASQKLNSLGLNIKVDSGGPATNSSIIVSQNPDAGKVVVSGFTIHVTLAPAVTPTVTVPVTGVIDQPWTTAQANLKSANITNYTLINAGPNLNFGTDIVKGTNPSGGGTIPVGQTLQVFIWNCSSICTTGTPTAVPTTQPMPTPSPTTGITPTPSPTPGITPTPSPTPGITPTGSPGITPTPNSTPKPDPTP